MTEEREYEEVKYGSLRPMIRWKGVICKGVAVGEVKRKEGIGMMRMLAGVGLFSLSLLLLYSVKKIYDYRDMRKMDLRQHYEDYGIYITAEAFAKGRPVLDIEQMLSRSYEFDAKRIEEAMALALPHRKDSDGGYSAFIQAVNQVLGEEVYEADRRKVDIS